MSMLFLCTNYNFSGCVKKGTPRVVLVDSKIFDRHFKIVNLAIYSKADNAYYFVRIISQIESIK